MVLMGLRAARYLRHVYTARSAIWRGPLSGRDSSGRSAAPWSRHRGLDSWVGTNWPGFLMMQSVAVLLVGEF